LRQPTSTIPAADRFFSSGSQVKLVAVRSPAGKPNEKGESVSALARLLIVEAGWAIG
jgi:hypothetical protein